VYYAYILKLKDKSYYIGYSNNLKKRILEHKRGGVKTTRTLLPFELVFYCAFKTKNKATKFERYLKEGSGFAFKNKHLI
jgi:putative endonuclease